MTLQWAALKGRKVKITTKDGSKQFLGSVVKKEGEDSFLVDWDDGSTSKVHTVKGVIISAALRHHAAALDPIPVEVCVVWDDDHIKDARSTSIDNLEKSFEEPPSTAPATPECNAKAAPRPLTVLRERRTPVTWSPGAAVFNVILTLHEESKSTQDKTRRKVREETALHIYDFVVADRVIGNNIFSKSATAGKLGKSRKYDSMDISMEPPVLERSSSDSISSHKRQLSSMTPTSQSHRPPSAAASAAVWKAASTRRNQRAASTRNITPADHMTIFLERTLLEASGTGSGSLETYSDLSSLKIRLSMWLPNLNQCEIPTTQSSVQMRCKPTIAGNHSKSRGKLCENQDALLVGSGVSDEKVYGEWSGPGGVRGALRRFIRQHGPLIGSTFEDDGRTWLVVDEGVDTDTRQRVAYYISVSAHSVEEYQKQINEGDVIVDSLAGCEWSSLKEVWAWRMRSTYGAKSGEQRRMVGLLADALEHTDIGDEDFKYDRTDISSDFLDEFREHEESIYRKMQKQPSSFSCLSSSSSSDSLATCSIKWRNFDVSDAAVLAALESVDVPENRSRDNVRQTPDQILEAMCLGAVNCRAAGIQASAYMRERPNLTSLLVRYATERLKAVSVNSKKNTKKTVKLKSRKQQKEKEDLLSCSRQERGSEDVDSAEVQNYNRTLSDVQDDRIAELRNDFCFTSIQVNKNYASALHVDRNNCGPSLIVGLGEYEGGDLWTYDRGALSANNGHWRVFDGNLPHATLCFRGTRYTLIYFTIKQHEEILPFHRQRLIEAGFPLPCKINLRRKHGLLEEGRYRVSPNPLLSANSLQGHYFPKVTTNRRGTGPGGVYPSRIVARGHSAFQSWLRMNNKDRKWLAACSDSSTRDASQLLGQYPRSPRTTMSKQCTAWLEQHQQLACGPCCSALYNKMIPVRCLETPTALLATDGKTTAESHKSCSTNDGDEYLVDVTDNQILKLNGEESVPIYVGTRVEARHKRGPLWYPGSVISVYEYGVDILYDDGDKERGVSASFIRPLMSGLPPRQPEASIQSLSPATVSFLSIPSPVPSPVSPSLSCVSERILNSRQQSINVANSARGCTISSRPVSCPLMLDVEVVELNTHREAVDQDRKSPRSNALEAIDAGISNHANVDLDLRKLAKRFPRGLRIYDKNLDEASCDQMPSKSRKDPERIVVGYYLNICDNTQEGIEMSSEEAETPQKQSKGFTKSDDQEDRYEGSSSIVAGLTWLVRTRSLSFELNKKRRGEQQMVAATPSVVDRLHSQPVFENSNPSKVSPIDSDPSIVVHSSEIPIESLEDHSNVDYRCASKRDRYLFSLMVNEYNRRREDNRRALFAERRLVKLENRREERRVFLLEHFMFSRPTSATISDLTHISSVERDERLSIPPKDNSILSSDSSIGAEVQKEFGESRKMFKGKVVSISNSFQNAMDGDVWYEILYEDGDREHITEDELKKIIIQPDNFELAVVQNATSKANECVPYESNRPKYTALLFDFDENELRVVTGLRYFDSGAGHGWSLVTKIINTAEDWPKNEIKIKGSALKSQNLKSTMKDGTEYESDIEYYLAHTDEQVADVDAMAYAAADVDWEFALGIGRTASHRNEAKSLLKKRWDACVCQARARGRDFVRQMILKKFPIPSFYGKKRKYSETDFNRSDVNQINKSEVPVGTVLYDARRAERRYAFDIELIANDTHKSGVPITSKRQDLHIKEGLGQWMILTQLVSSPPPVRNADLAEVILYPVHTIDDRDNFAKMVVKAETSDFKAFLGRFSSTPTKQIKKKKLRKQKSSCILKAPTSEEKTNASARSTKQSQIDTSEMRREQPKRLRSLVPKAWDTADAEELLYKIPMQSFPIILEDPSYKPFRQRARTFKTVTEAMRVAAASESWMRIHDVTLERTLGKARYTRLRSLADEPPSRALPFAPINTDVRDEFVDKASILSTQRGGRRGEKHSCVNSLIISRFLSDLPLQSIDEAALQTALGTVPSPLEIRSGKRRKMTRASSSVSGSSFSEASARLRGIQAATVARLLSPGDYIALASAEGS